MTKLRVVLPAFLLLVLFLMTGRESFAVIYKYTNEKGVSVYADDMQKIHRRRLPARPAGGL